MFEVGKIYRVRTIEYTRDGPQIAGHPLYEVTDVQWPLVRFKGGLILNVSAPTFVDARPDDHDLENPF